MWALFVLNIRRIRTWTRACVCVCLLYTACMRNRVFILTKCEYTSLPLGSQFTTWYLLYCFSSPLPLPLPYTLYFVYTIHLHAYCNSYPSTKIIIIIIVRIGIIFLYPPSLSIYFERINKFNNTVPINHIKRTNNNHSHNIHLIRIYSFLFYYLFTQILYGW
jgi:hypothetical protein